VQHPAGELVDDEHLAVDDDVVTVLLVELLGLQRVVDEADQGGVARLVQVADAELVLDLLDALVGELHRALLQVDLVVVLGVDLVELSCALLGGVLGGVDALHALGDAGQLLVPILDRHVVEALRVGRAADDQRGTGLVDQDGVDLVDDREEVPSLDQLLVTPRHVVAQVVEAELVVGAVGDVAGVGGPVRLRGLVAEDDADIEAEETVHPAHPLRVALGEVVVDRDDVHAVAGQCVEIGRQRADERLALTGLHLGDVAQVQGRTTHQLDVEVPLAQGALGGLADGGECLRQQAVEALAVGHPLLVRRGQRAQLVVGELGVLRFEGVDGVGVRLEPAQDLALAGAKDLLEYHEVLSSLADVLPPSYSHLASRQTNR